MKTALVYAKDTHIIKYTIKLPINNSIEETLDDSEDYVLYNGEDRLPKGAKIDPITKKIYVEEIIISDEERSRIIEQTKKIRENEVKGIKENKILQEYSLYKQLNNITDILLILVDQLDLNKLSDDKVKVIEDILKSWETIREFRK